MRIALDDPTRPAVLSLLEEHLADMFATSPAESVHALDAASLAGPGMTFWTLSEGDQVLGTAALKELDPTHGEIKSMRTAAAARRRGVAGRLLDHLLATATERGYTRLSLETGSQDYFAPARRLYRSRGFVECDPFASYVLDPHSRFLTRVLAG